VLTFPVYLQHFDEQVQALVLDEMAAGGRRLVGEVPERAQRELERGVHDALRGFLTHDVEQLLK